MVSKDQRCPMFESWNGKNNGANTATPTGLRARATEATHRRYKQGTKT